MSDTGLADQSAGDLDGYVDAIGWTIARMVGPDAAAILRRLIEANADLHAAWPRLAKATITCPEQALSALTTLGWQPPATLRRDEDEGWYAREDDEPPHGERFRWQPCLQADGMQHAVDMWFDTEQACLAYVAEHVLGRGLLYPDEVPRSTSAGA